MTYEDRLWVDGQTLIDANWVSACPGPHAPADQVAHVQNVARNLTGSYTPPAPLPHLTKGPAP